MKLRTRLFQLVAGIVIPLVALACVLGYLLVERENETFRKGALDRNRAFMTAVDAEIRGHLSTVAALAAAESLAANNLRRFYGDAVRVLKSQPDWQNIVMVTPSGQQIINAARPFGARSPTNLDMESTQRVARTLAPTAGDVIFGRVTQKYGIPLRVPVMQNGTLKYILTAVIGPEAFEKLIRAQNLPAGWVSGLVDSSGHFIARVPPRSPADMASKDFLSAVARSNEGWYRGLTVEGNDTFTSHKTSELSNWSVGLAIPVSEVNAAAYNAAWILGVGTLATLALAIGFAYWMGRRIAVPIASLVAAARSLGRNTIPTDLDADAGISEVREVARALKDASQAIRERQQLVEREQTALKAADRAKDEFLAMLGHELRNPLGAITTSAHVLRIAKPGHEAIPRAQDVIERQTKHMTRLIEDLLDISRLAMGKVTLRKEVFDLSGLAGRVVRTWEESGRSGARQLALDASPVCVEADRARVEQILSNLLDNADKFSPPGRAIRVSVSREDEQAVLEVADEGEGILPEMLHRVFELFVQGQQRPDRARGGMGVGLALVKRIAEMHGGAVAAASNGLGAGATFTVRLPVATRSIQEERRKPSVPLRRDARRILVVEDNEDAREMMLALLMLEGHHAQGLSNGASALLEAEKWQPDIILVDVGLPDIDGYEVARRIRAVDTNGHIKLVAVTGYGQAEDERRASEAGFDLHLTKPVSPELLRHVLSALTPKESLH